MDRLAKKRNSLDKRIKRVRGSLSPIRKPMRPRLVINRSNRHIFIQVINDLEQKTIAQASTAEKGYSGPLKNKEAAIKMGEVIAERAIKKGIKEVVLDRRGRLYHGCIAAFAEKAREKGLVF
ncbi:MAG: 50S ribosomal protein L18 [Spirochaetales bacterium]|nr:50S ribosomal protein L18 [Spirochaetales bacterium]